MKIRKNIILLYAIAFLQGMVFYSSIATLYRQAAGVTVFQISVIESICLALSLALEMPWGFFAEKIGYKNTMVFCNILYFFSKIIFWKADGFGMFLAERVILAVVCSGLSGVDSSILWLSCAQSDAQKTIAVYQGLGEAGMLVSAGVYTVFIHGQYRTAAFFTVQSYGLAMLCTLFLAEVKGTPGQEKITVSGFADILKNTLGSRKLLLLLAGTALFSQCHQSITVFLNQLQYVRCQMSDQLIGLVYIAVTLAGLLGFCSSRFTQKLGRQTAGTALIGTGAVSCLLLAFTGNMWLSAACVLALRTAYSLYAPLANVLQNEQITHPNRAAALSIHSLLMDAVMILAELLLGKTADRNLPAAFALAAGFYLIALVCFRFCMKRADGPAAFRS